MNCGHKFSFSVIKLLQTSNKLQPHIPLNYKLLVLKYINMSYFAYACKTEGQNGISRLISELLRTLDSSLRDRLFVLQNEVFWTT